MLDRDKFVHPSEQSSDTAPETQLPFLADLALQERETGMKSFVFDGTAVHYYVLYQPHDDKTISVEHGAGPFPEGYSPILLCHIIALPESRRVYVSPQFNKPCGATHGVNTYEYIISNESEGVSGQPPALPDQEARLRLEQLQANQMGTFVNLPLPNSRLMFVNGEIVSTSGFVHESVYVEYKADVASDWTVGATGKTEGVTQIAAPKILGMVLDGATTATAMFGHPFHLAMDWHPQGESEEPSCPTLLLRVNSFDYWERSVTLGYGHIRFPAHPGSYDLRVPTWRPAPSVRDQMRSFFVGGAPELSSTSYLVGGREHPNGPINRLGFPTESAGSIHIRLHVLVVATGHLPTAAAATRDAAWVSAPGGPMSHLARIPGTGARTARRRLRANQAPVIGAPYAPHAVLPPVTAVPMPTTLTPRDPAAAVGPRALPLLPAQRAPMALPLLPSGHLSAMR